MRAITSFVEVGAISSAVVLAGCPVEPSGDLLPGQANAEYSVQVGLGSGQADCGAAYYQGLASLSFSNGETVTANGVALAEESLLGVGYYGSVPVVAAGQPYRFALQVPNKGSFETDLVMPAGASLTAPAPGAQAPSGTALTVTWSNASSGATDTVAVHLDASGNGQSVDRTWPAPAGAMTLTVSTSDMQAMYHQAAGASPGTVTGTLTLHRGHQTTLGAPFAGGSSTIDVELDQVSISVTP
jgi:hypothetical protein